MYHKINELTETYCLIVLEVRGLKSRYWQGHASSEGVKEESVPDPSLSFLAVFCPFGLLQ